MAAFIAPAAAAGAGIITNIMGNASNRKIAREQMDFQQDMVEKQMRFQKEMSGTAYQRAIQDMKAAGVNPMLAYSQGGASSPQGSTAVGARRDYKAPISELIQNALSARQAVANIQQTREQTRLIAAQAHLQELREPKARVQSEPWKYADKTLERAGISADETRKRFADSFLWRPNIPPETYQKYKNKFNW